MLPRRRRAAHRASSRHSGNRCCRHFLPIVTPDSTPPNPDAGADESPLVRLEHAVEVALEEAIAATERSLVQRFGAHCVRALRLALAATWTALVVAFFTF